MQGLHGWLGAIDAEGSQYILEYSDAGSEALHRFVSELLLRLASPSLRLASLDTSPSASFSFSTCCSSGQLQEVYAGVLPSERKEVYFE